VELAVACDARPLRECPELGETATLTLSGVLSSVLRECGEWDNVVAVRFEQGCAVAFELASDATALSAATASPSVAVPPDAGAPDTGAPDRVLPDAGPLTADALDSVAPDRADVRRCVADRLALQRYACARDIACSLGASFPIPTR